MNLDTIYNEDCMAGLDRIPDNSIDLVATDPPYLIDVVGSGCFGSKNKLYHQDLEHLSHGIDNAVLEKIVSKLKAINLYVWCNKAQFRQYIDFFDDLGCYVDLITWHKPNPVPAANNKYLSDTEYLFFFREKGVKLYGTYSTKTKHYELPCNVADKERYNHPTVKPLEIMRNIIINSTQVGDIVLDPFMGTGTTAVACVETCRHFVGFEIDEEYHRTALDRLAAARPRKHLFRQQSHLLAFEEG